MSRWSILFLVLMPAACSRSGPENRLERADSVEATVRAVVDEVGPVPANRGPDVEDGFEGAVHPALELGETLEVRAYCSPIGTGRGFDEGYFPRQFRGPFDSYVVADAVEEYSSQELSAFFPQEIGEVGQLWEVQVDRVAPFLKQFHPGASVKLEAPGRRGGPNGGFAVLRAISDTHLDILARIHGEFVLAPGTYLTPAYFECRMLVDRIARRVRFFSLAVPTDLGLNTTLTAVLPTEALIDIVHLDRMELIGGDSGAAMESGWTREIPIDEARRTLKRPFYKFLDIEWVDADLAIGKARELNRPILAIVLWGDLDDQSC